jgi:hypothetical protein
MQFHGEPELEKRALGIISEYYRNPGAVGLILYGELLRRQNPETDMRAVLERTQREVSLLLLEPLPF